MLVTSMKSSSARVAKPHGSHLGSSLGASETFKLGLSSKLSIGLGLFTSAFLVCAEPASTPEATAGDSVNQTSVHNASMDNSATTVCEGISLQVLGSGGPELDDGRASTSYLLWKDDKGRVLVDAGSGSSVQFGASGADFTDIDTILLSHLHTDHAADLPSFIKGSYFTRRDTDLSVYGPAGNDLMPSIQAYLDALIGKEGAFKYLSSYTQEGEDDYKVSAHTIADNAFSTSINNDISIDAVSVHHGPIPALAWKVTIDECVAVFSGDTNNADGTLANFAKHADVLVLHNAIEDIEKGAGSAATNLHMTPKQIIEIAKASEAKRIVLSHIMKRSEAGLDGLTEAIAVIAPGRVFAAQDLMNIPLVSDLSSEEGR
ncbi:MBL fold metallo-hydrolase [Alteromonas sp. CI.11.F.A3]|uniref:MBL fold metallo-hydrolase n=1 Tax=Alteromonas sp. CI.11.F.A3 TaxID=3079555 RepID=UPI002942993E|nr:MBL fold metallo-hydrolase [Alteromonas sp. CI.11.F.A3]WOI37683.1 MBL fold metallo-hydrolase [Alteromonas sp. CI.11.F.A3]